MVKLRFRASQVRIAAAITALVTLGACGTKVEAPPPGTGGGGAGTTGTSDTTTSTGTTSTRPDCWKCACELLSQQGGCREVCDHVQISGPPEPFLCDGGFIHQNCQMCLAMSCGLPDASTCLGLYGAACSSDADCWYPYCKAGVCQ